MDTKILEELEAAYSEEFDLVGGIWERWSRWCEIRCGNWDRACCSVWCSVSPTDIKAVVCRVPAAVPNVS